MGPSHSTNKQRDSNSAIKTHPVNFDIEGLISRELLLVRNEAKCLSCRLMLGALPQSACGGGDVVDGNDAAAMLLRAMDCKPCGGMHCQHALAPAPINDNQCSVSPSYSRSHCILVFGNCTCWDFDDILGVSSELRPDEDLQRHPDNEQGISSLRVPLCSNLSFLEEALTTVSISDMLRKARAYISYDVSFIARVAQSQQGGIY